VVVLTVVALFPALALGGLAVFAGSQATPDANIAPATTVGQALPAPMATPLLSVRRAPAALASDRQLDLLLDSLVPLADSVDGQSCLSVSFNDRTLVSRNDQVVIIPASNVKVITAAVALEVLGPGTTFSTTVVGPAPVGGVIEGDVHLVGGGDPVLSEQWYAQAADGRKRPPFHVTDVNALADQFVATGVRQITGRVVGDGSRYDDERYPPGWSNDIRATADGTPVGALVINDSTTRSAGHADDPAKSAATTFVSLLADRGVTVGEGSAVGVAPTGLPVLASVTSAALTDIVNEMLATSDNLTAEMLVKEIGRAAGTQGTRTAGLLAITQLLAAWGVPTAGLVLTDGSGLSRDNQFTCATLSAVLQRGAATDAVGVGMARAAQAGSTLADSFQQAGLAGVLQGKTGTLREVKSLSGYFVAGTTEVSFVLVLNGGSAASFQTQWDLLAASLLASTSGPAVALLAPGVG